MHLLSLQRGTIADGREAVDLGQTGARVLMLSAADTLVARPTAELLREHAPGVPVRGDVPGRCPLVDARRAQELLGFLPRHSVHATPPSVVGPRRPAVGRPAR